MARKLQHIVWRDELNVATEAGVKAESLCGKRIHQKPGMSPEIPTCTPCSRLMMQEHNRLADQANRPAFKWRVVVDTVADLADRKMGPGWA